MTRDDSKGQINITSFGPQDSFKAGDRLLVVEIWHGTHKVPKASAFLYQMFDDREAVLNWQTDASSTAIVNSATDRISGEINAAQASPTVSLGFDAPIQKPSPSPLCLPSVASLATSSFAGRVFDTHNNTIASATVEIVSTNTSNPYDSRVSVRNGSYRFNQVPFGVMLDVTVRAEGYQSQTRSVELPGMLAVPGDAANCGWTGPSILNWINFGGQDPRDPQGGAYALKPLTAEATATATPQ